MENEPHFKKGSCSYCGTAPINHFAAFIDGCISAFLEPLGKSTPAFLDNFVEKIPSFIFSALASISIVRFSNDPQKALSYRSRVVWEEANRRNIKMQQAGIGHWLFEFYRAKMNDKWFYFQSLPVPPKFSEEKETWDDKILLKQKLASAGIPTPRFEKISFFSRIQPEKLFAKLGASLIIKPRLGSRGRHTTINIETPQALYGAIALGRKISPSLSAEEYLKGYVCRATVVHGTLAGFYRANAPAVIGDGQKTIRELIEEKNSSRPDRVEKIIFSDEIKRYIGSYGYEPRGVLPDKLKLQLTHRTGRSHGGSTKEMIDLLHPSFIPILEKAADVLGLSVVGFDCIIPDPEQDANSQRWGIIESNSLPFIDLHYYALEGKPRNIAGMIWDLWDK